VNTSDVSQDSLMGLIPRQEKKRMMNDGNISFVDVNQDEMIGNWDSDRLKNLSQTQRLVKGFLIF
jgi:hypothetical protein